MRVGRFSIQMVAVVTTVFALASSASALLNIDFTAVGIPHTVGPQSTSNPCIIAGTQCQQPAGFGFNNFTQGGNIAAFNASSTTPTANVPDGTAGTPYTVAQLTAAGLTSFVVAIDVNTASGGETLQAFNVFINGVLRDSLILADVGLNIGSLTDNGNGFGDWVSNPISLAGLAGTDTVRFQAIWNGADDGAESFFLISSTSPQVPEPGTLLLLGTGLVGLAAFARKKFRR